jgi:hypothetical protein
MGDWMGDWMGAMKMRMRKVDWMGAMNYREIFFHPFRTPLFRFYF